MLWRAPTIRRDPSLAIPAACQVLPPREIYRVEAITKSDDPDVPGWAYFLDLWTETGPARLHIEGALEESGERFTTTLNDILP